MLTQSICTNYKPVRTRFVEKAVAMDYISPLNLMPARMGLEEEEMIHESQRHQMFDTGYGTSSATGSLNSYPQYSGSSENSQCFNSNDLLSAAEPYTSCELFKMAISRGMHLDSLTEGFQAPSSFGSCSSDPEAGHLVDITPTSCPPRMWNTTVPASTTLKQEDHHLTRQGSNDVHVPSPTFDSAPASFMQGRGSVYTTSPTSSQEDLCGQMGGFPTGRGSLEALMQLSSGDYMHQLGRKRTLPPTLQSILAGSLLDDVAAEHRAKLEVKRIRRMESNRASARRSRQRKAEVLDTLHRENLKLRDDYVPHIMQEKLDMEEKLKESERRISNLEREKKELTEQIKCLRGTLPLCAQLSPPPSPPATN